MVQKIAHQRNIDPSEVNLSRVKLRMLPKEALETAEAPGSIDESTEATKLPERPTGVLPTTFSPEKADEGEKENMEIEKLVHKRKKEETYSPDKRRKLCSRSEVDRTRKEGTDGTGRNPSQDSTAKEATNAPPKRRGNHCARGKDGKFMSHARWEREKTQALHANQERTADTPTTDAEEQTKQNSDTKETEPLVILKDLKFVLPQEAFCGKTVSSHKIESIIEPVSRFDPTLMPHMALDGNASPLQLVFSALSVYHPPIDDLENETPGPSTQISPGVPVVCTKVCGRCVVCGCNFTVPASAWHSVEDNVRPPTLLVPVRWVCVSLAVCLPQVSEEDARLAKVVTLVLRSRVFSFTPDQFGSLLVTYCIDQIS